MAARQPPPPSIIAPRGRARRASALPPPSGADRYFRAWALVLPIQSVLVIPFVQGTTPGNLFALALLFPPFAALLLSLDGARKLYGTLLWIALGFVLLVAVAQLGLASLGVRHLAALPLVDPVDKTVVLRGTLFTQSLYLLVAVTMFAFARWFYRRDWDRWFLAGAVLLAAYGFYELVHFAVLGTSGDYVSNRTFGGGYHPGSWFQTIALGPFVVQRLKSLTGEPAMFAFTILPFWIYALHTGRTKTHWFLLAALLATASTTAVLGIAVCVALRVLWFGNFDRVTVGAAVVGLALFACWGTGVPVIAEAIDKVLLQKLSLQSVSSVDRFQGFQAGLRYFLDAPFPIQLFGVGFGYTRGTNMFTTLLVNSGMVGFAIATAVFAYPILALGGGEREQGLKAALAVVYVTLMVSVPEYGYLSSWLFLGIAYHEALAHRRARRRAAAAAGRQQTVALSS
jgi:hypothetical protein